jgi:hypothetical protein
VAVADHEHAEIGIVVAPAGAQLDLAAEGRDERPTRRTSLSPSASGSASPPAPRSAIGGRIRDARR